MDVGQWIKRSVAMAVPPFCLLAVIDGRAETLLEKDGVALTGTAVVVEHGAATCLVREDGQPEEVYERIKGNQGKPLNLWRLEFSVHNRSGKALDHLIASYYLESPWPPCTTWDGAVGAGVQWTNQAGHIQRSSEPYSVAPDEIVTEEFVILASHNDTPKFTRWSLNFDFADGQWAGATEAGASANAVPDRPPRAAIEPTCAGKAKGAACWKPLSDRPDCQVWESYLDTDQTVTWSGECDGGLAQAEGTLTWRQGDADSYTESGRLDDGRAQGHWVVRSEDGRVDEGPYVDGERHGRWVTGWADVRVDEGPYVDGKRHGHWVRRWADGSVDEGPYVDGKKHGHWVFRYASGNVQEASYVDGKRHGHWVERWADGGGS